MMPCSRLVAISGSLARKFIRGRRRKEEKRGGENEKEVDKQREGRREGGREGK